MTAPTNKTTRAGMLPIIDPGITTSRPIISSSFVRRIKPEITNSAKIRAVRIQI
jgi:hypothetical protein